MNKEKRDAYNEEVRNFHKEFPNASMTFYIREPEDTEWDGVNPIVCAKWKNVGEGSFQSRADVMMRFRNIVGENKF